MGGAAIDRCAGDEHRAGADDAYRTGTAAARAGRSPSTLRRLLRDAEKEIAAHEHRRNTLIGELAAAGHDHQLLTRLGHELADTETALGASEERWLELSTELDAGPTTSP
jgi:hypothetical protein